MADVPPFRRKASRHSISALAIAALASSAGACAGLLDLPSEPYVAETGDEAAGDGTEQPASESDPAPVASGDGPEVNPGSPAPASPAAGKGTAPNSGTATPLGAVVPTPGSSSASESPASEPNAETAVDEPAPLDSADAGSGAPAPVPDDPAPEPPLVACAPGETLGPRGTCYFAVARSLSWVNARQNCRARGTGWDLASIRSAADNRVVGQLIDDESWLGASDAASEGAWVWVIDGAPFWRGDESGDDVNGAFETWNSDEPNGGGTSDCARAVPDNPPRASGPTWADFECGEQLGSLCEGPAR